MSEVNSPDDVEGPPHLQTEYIRVWIYPLL